MQRYAENITLQKGCNTSVFTGVSQKPLDTLAHLRQSPKKTLYKKAIAKYVTNEILMPLIDLKSSRYKSYWNTYHCVETLFQNENGKITSTYCKQRWCVVCNRIRTAKLINGYSPVLKNMKDLKFVTLTVPNVSGIELREKIDEMQKTWRSILHKARRTDKIQLNGIRKLETTHNFRTNEFHPHYHIIVQGEKEANYIRDAWLKMNKTSVYKAQDVRNADKNSVIELFKYFTKLYTKKENGKVQTYTPEAMDTIFAALRNKRVVQSFGNVKQVSDDFEDIEADVIVDETREVLWSWEQQYATWIDYSTGEMLTECAKDGNYIENEEVDTC